MWMRRISVVVAVALTAGLLSTPAHSFGDPEKIWPGKWLTDHKYGQPVLRLTYDGDYLKGTYANDEGKVLGNISGTLSSPHNRTWSGRYRDRDGSGRGRFSVFLKDSPEPEYEYEFEGWFKPSGGDRLDWFGYKVPKK